MPTPRTKRPKRITARSITLEDAKGNPRIFMDAGDGDGNVEICLFGDGGHSIQISTSSKGGLHILLSGQKGQDSAVLGMNSDGDAGLIIHDRKGLPGSRLGPIAGSCEQALTLFKGGKPVWSTPNSSQSMT